MKPPAGTRPLVREAYQRELSPRRVGLTEADLRQLHAAVARGELLYRQDMNMPGRWMYWIPARPWEG